MHEGLQDPLQISLKNKLCKVLKQGPTLTSVLVFDLVLELAIRNTNRTMIMARRHNLCVLGIGARLLSCAAGSGISSEARTRKNPNCALSGPVSSVQAFRKRWTDTRENRPNFFGCVFNSKTVSDSWR